MNRILLLLTACLLSLQNVYAQQTAPPFDIVHATGTGFKAEYYDGDDFDRKVLTRIDKQINFHLVHQSPIKGLNPDNFSIRWTAKLYVPKTGKYRFIFVADDGVRLWVDNKLLIDEWRPTMPAKFSAVISLQGQQLHDLKIEYSQMEAIDAVAEAYLEFENQGEQPINPNYVFTSAPRTIPIVPPKSQPQSPNNKPVTTSVAKKEVITKEETSVPVARKEEPLKPLKKTDPASMPEINKDLPPEKFENLEVGTAMVLSHIFFDQGRHELRPESYAELDKLVSTLRKFHQFNISIAGHTDNVGDFYTNVQLSRDRAKAVALYLASKGIDEKRIAHTGYGSLYPVAPNTTEENKVKNRRVEFTLK